MTKSLDLTSVPKESFWRLSIPILGFIFFNALYGMVDMYWVSRLDEISFYAAGVSMPIFTLICAIGDSMGQGANSLMSRSIGLMTMTGYMMPFSMEYLFVW